MSWIQDGHVGSHAREGVKGSADRAGIRLLGQESWRCELSSALPPARVFPWRAAAGRGGPPPPRGRGLPPGRSPQGSAGGPGQPLAAPPPRGQPPLRERGRRRGGPQAPGWATGARGETQAGLHPGEVFFFYSVLHWTVPSPSPFKGFQKEVLFLSLSVSESETMLP